MRSEEEIRRLRLVCADALGRDVLREDDRALVTGLLGSLNWVLETGTQVDIARLVAILVAGAIPRH